MAQRMLEDREFMMMARSKFEERGSQLHVQQERSDEELTPTSGSSGYTISNENLIKGKTKIDDSNRNSE